MKIYRVSNKTLMVRHWLKWYTVERGAKDWKKLKTEPRQRPFNINQVANTLQGRYGKSQKAPSFEALTEKQPTKRHAKKAAA